MFGVPLPQTYFLYSATHDSAALLLSLHLHLRVVVVLALVYKHKRKPKSSKGYIKLVSMIKKNELCQTDL